MIQEQNFSPLTQEEFSRLPTLDKHEFTENLMSDKIAFTYRDALNRLQSIINNPELSEAFNNFVNFKNLKISKIDACTKVLLNISFDKVNGIFNFIVKEGNENKLTHSIYDLSIDEFSASNKLKPFYRTLYDSRFCNDGDAHPDTIKNIVFSFTNKEIDELWKESMLLFKTQNENEPEVQTTFRSLSKINQETRIANNVVYNHSHPAFTVIDPDDIVNMKSRNIKNARF